MDILLVEVRQLTAATDAGGTRERRENTGLSDYGGTIKEIKSRALEEIHLPARESRRT